MTYSQKQKTRLSSKRGFTLLEVLFSIGIFSIVMLTAYALFSVAQNTYNQGGNDIELWQNARASLDRITREIRQAQEIATALPEESGDPLNPPSSEIEFQDGHDTSQITYIRYYLNGADLMRRSLAYYFSSDPDIYLYSDALDDFGNPPDELILEDSLIGEYFSDLDFWSVNNVVNIYIKLEKANRDIELMTAVYGRNL
ncbi:MAG: type II secretion system protein [Patescibacteria group bacterium]|jgi:prepilin-type N-terminal cleavage/methylation domain-containing protein